MSRFTFILPLLAVVSLLLPAASGCSRGDDLNSRVGAITAPYQFHIAAWEIGALGSLVGDIFHGGKAVSDNADLIYAYFDNVDQIRGLRSNIATAGAGDMPPLEDELSTLVGRNSGMAGDVVDELKVQIRDALARAGINNPFERYVKSSFGFPPIEAVLASPPHLLVISPRDRIENIKQVYLLQEMSREEMESIETQVDAMGYSSLVVPLGGISTYPSFVSNDADLRYTIDSIAHEWLHQYLAFKPLGFLALLNAVGIRQDYDISTINETVVGMVAGEIAASVYEIYFPGAAEEGTPAAPPASGFDFNRVMRETRQAVDTYLAAGEIDRAEAYMEQQRQYLAANGYQVRKLNQAYFAFYGTYADSPTSISPIGVDLRTLRAESPSLRDFLDTAASLSSRQELEGKITGNKIQ